MPRGFLVAWTVAIFLVPNLVLVGGEFDMNKFFQVMWIAVAIMAAWLIRDWRPWAIAGVMLFTAIWPVPVGLWQLWNPAVVLSLEQEATGR